MFNVKAETRVLKVLKKEGYTFEFEINKVIVRTKEGEFSFGIIYKEENYELLVFSTKGIGYVDSVMIEFDKIEKCPILKTETKHDENTVYKTIKC